MLGALQEIVSPPLGNPPPPDRGLNDSVYANLDNLVCERTASLAPVLDPPLATVTALAAAATTLTAPAAPIRTQGTAPVALAAPVTAATTALTIPLKKRNNIPSLLNTADSLREQVELAEMSK